MSAVLLSTDLLGISKIAGAAERAGCTLATTASAAGVIARFATSPARLVVIDLSTTRDDLAHLVQVSCAAARAPHCDPGFWATRT